MEDLFATAARLLGWTWSPPHEGLISARHLLPGYSDPDTPRYLVAEDTVHACSIDRLSTIGAVRKFLADSVLP